MPYTKSGPTSAYQRFIRGENNELHDHICKEMNALNLERCRWGLEGRAGTVQMTARGGLVERPSSWRPSL